MSACYLVFVAVFFEEVEFLYGQLSCHDAVGEVFGINQFHGCRIVSDELSSADGVEQMFGDGTEGVSLEVYISCFSCRYVAFYK